CREVDAYTQGVVSQAFQIPALNLIADFSERPVANGQDHAGFFGGLNEFARRQEAAFRVLPADERFKANDLAGGKLDLGLVVEHKLALIERDPQIGPVRPGAMRDGGYGSGGKAALGELRLLERATQAAELQLARGHFRQA